MSGISALTNALGSEDIVVIAQDPVLVVVHVDDQVHGLGAVGLGVQFEGICDVREETGSALSFLEVFHAIGPRGTTGSKKKKLTKDNVLVGLEARSDLDLC